VTDLCFELLQPQFVLSIRQESSKNTRNFLSAAQIYSSVVRGDTDEQRQQKISVVGHLVRDAGQVHEFGQQCNGTCATCPQLSNTLLFYSSRKESSREGATPVLAAATGSERGKEKRCGRGLLSVAQKAKGDTPNHKGTVRTCGGPAAAARDP
jgi:hypothetical protein